MTALINKQAALTFKAKLLPAGEGRNAFPLAGGWLVGQPLDKTMEHKALSLAPPVQWDVDL